jgi:membrane fusion protein (multidrug efflux system)
MRRNLLVCALLIGGLSACGGGDPAAEAAAGGPPGGMQLPVETVKVEPQSLSTGLQTVGSLRADESVVVRPEVAGRIVRIHFKEGGAVKAGQSLFSLDASTAQAALNEAQANFANSRRAAARANQLVGQQLIARSDYDNARAAQAVDQARVESARTALTKMTLSAPFSGQMGLREVSVGDFITVGQNLVTLVRLDPIEVDFSLPESTIASLRSGQAIAITVDAFPGETFDGEVVAIDPSIDINSRSAKLRAQIANSDGRLRPGQFARLRIEVGDGNGSALLVPEQALMQEGDTRFVYTVVDGKAKKTVIKTGTRLPGMLEVTDGLKAGDVVITAGQAKPMMHDGMAVMALPSGDDKAPAGDAAQPEGDAQAVPETPSTDQPSEDNAQAE